MEQVEKFIHWLNDNIVWGPVMLVLLVGTGIWLTLILRGLQFGMLFYALKQAFRPHPKKAVISAPKCDTSPSWSLPSSFLGCGRKACFKA